jgi:hypothetical protein
LGSRPREAIERAGQASDFWSDAVWIPCRDGRWRPTQPGLFPLAARVPARVGRLRGYGNAIKPPLAAAFIQAYTEVSSTEGIARVAVSQARDRGDRPEPSNVFLLR